MTQEFFEDCSEFQSPETTQFRSPQTLGWKQKANIEGLIDFLLSSFGFKNCFWKQFYTAQPLISQSNFGFWFWFSLLLTHTWAILNLKFYTEKERKNKKWARTQGGWVGVRVEGESWISCFLIWGRMMQDHYFISSSLIWSKILALYQRN